GGTGMGSHQRGAYNGRQTGALGQWRDRLFRGGRGCAQEGCRMRRFALALLAVPMALTVGIVPVAADTFGAPGTYFYTSSSTCTTSAGLQTCQDVILNVTPDDTG